MDRNDKTLDDDPSQLKLLLDTNIYSWIQEIAAQTRINALNLLDQMENVSYYFAQCVVNEVIRGPGGLVTNNIPEMFRHSLVDEMSADFGGEADARILYNAKDGTTKVAVLTKISPVDHAQILLCHNHRKQHLVLVTNDHNMIKNAAAVLDHHLMDFQYLLKYIADSTPDGPVKTEWSKVVDYYDKNGNHTRPKTVRYINDRQPGV